MRRIENGSKRISPLAGFTLVEILIVVVIIGILAGLALPRFGRTATKAKQVEAKQHLQQIYMLQRAFRLEHDTYWIPTASTVANKDAPRAFAELGLELMPQARYEYSITGDQDHFEAHATSRSLDDDPTVDQWSIDETGQLQAISNDATE